MQSGKRRLDEEGDFLRKRGDDVKFLSSPKYIYAATTSSTKYTIKDSCVRDFSTRRKTTSTLPRDLGDREDPTESKLDTRAR